VLEAQIYRRALSIGLAGLVGVSVLVGSRLEFSGSSANLRRLTSIRLSPKLVSAAQPARRAAAPLTDELRGKGYNECNPQDPMGLGPYTPYRNVAMGRLTIPQKGGRAPDGGYDLVIHFHGHEAVRKTLVQVAQGVAYVGIDRGLGSGAYEQAFSCPDVFPALLGSIEKGLKAESGDPNAHIRHLALTAWSAGYGAVNEILKRNADRVDAVVLLDGLHGRWEPVPNRDPDKPLRSTAIAPVIEFARRAVKGEKIFIFTHSYIDPVDYTPTSVTADLLLVELGLQRKHVDPGGYAYGPDSRVDSAGFHVWSYKGKNELAHCAHIPLIAKALEIIEPAWQTPAMDRDVPFTKVKHWARAGSAAAEPQVAGAEATQPAPVETEEGAEPALEAPPAAE
jgi:hypothetical protein